MKKILVVDDSALMRRIVCDIISSDDDLGAPETAIDGLDAYNRIKSNDYDVVVLDMILPRMTGIELLSRMSAENIHVPVIITSSSLKEDAEQTITAMEKGAIDFVVKPFRGDAKAREEFADKLLKSVRLAVSHGSNGIKRTTANTTKPVSGTGSSLNKNVVKGTYSVPKTKSIDNSFTGGEFSPIKGGKIVALACSTGGPQALHVFMPMLPRNLPCPVVLTQHMPVGFTAGLATRLNSISEVYVKEAEEGEKLKKGTVYIAPGGKHLEIVQSGNNVACVSLSDAPPVGTLKPCADVMYKSLEAMDYDEIICVVLTGMGADGTNGIAGLKQKKNIYTITQNEESCVVYGMPRAVETKGLSNEVVPLDQVAKAITKKLGV